MDFTKVVSSDPLDKLKHILFFLTSIPLQSDFCERHAHTFFGKEGEGREEGCKDMEYELTLMGNNFSQSQKRKNLS